MLSLQHIKKSYDGVPVLQDITLDIKDGEIAVSYTHLDVYKRQFLH